MRHPVTSAESPLRVAFLPAESHGLPGSIGLTFAPGKKQPDGETANWDRDLGEDLDRLVDHFRATLLVSLIEDAEMKELAIPDLVHEARSRGLEVLRFPFEDGSVPAMDLLLEVVRRILEVARAGGTAVIHCKGGLGRTGLVAAACLVARGRSVADAVRITRDARKDAIEPKQEAFLPEVAKALRRAEEG